MKELSLHQDTSKVKLLAITVFLFFFLSAFLTALVIYLDDTNFGTANGLWKSVFVKEYMYHREEVDYQNLEELSFVSNLYYFPVYSWLILHSPLRYYNLIIVQKMAVVNAWFGGLALAAFYLLLFSITKNHLASLSGVLFHLAGGIFLTVSTTSEDIIPAYAFFVLAMVFLVKYLKEGSLKWLSFTTVSYTVSWLFQWTMAPGVLPALALVILLKQRSIINTLIHWGVFLLTTLLIAGLSALYFKAYFFQVLFPGKSLNSGWITGLSWEKLVLLYTGFMQYIIGGFQFLGMEHFMDTLTGSNWYYPSFIASSVIFLILTSFIVYYFIKNCSTPWLLYFGTFLLVTFLVAQLMNSIEFATDLQFHIQPMAYLPVAYGLLSDKLMKMSLWKRIRAAKPLLVFTLFLFPAILLAFNLKKYRIERKGLDSYYMDQIKKVEGEIEDLNNTFFVTRGWDEFRNWAYSYWGRDFRHNTITVTDFIRDYPKESPEDAAMRLQDTIVNRLESGYLVLTGPEIIDRPEYEILFMFEGFQQNEKVKLLLNTVKNDFDRTPYVQTELGTFYKITR